MVSGKIDKNYQINTQPLEAYTGAYLCPRIYPILPQKRPLPKNFVNQQPIFALPIRIASAIK